MSGAVSAELEVPLPGVHAVTILAGIKAERESNAA